MPSSMIFNPANWYWIVAGSTTQVYSSAANAYVPVTDATYQAWLARSNSPTKIDTEASLWEVLQRVLPGVLPAYLFDGTAFVPVAGAYNKAQLAGYAKEKQAKIVVGGISVNVGTAAAPQNVEASTDPASLVMLQGAYTMAQANASATFNWVESTGVTVTLTAAQVETIWTAVTNFVQG